MCAPIYATASSLSTCKQLERYVRIYRNMRLRDRATGRGVRAQKEQLAAQQEPNEYPLMPGDWSSCDESGEDIQWDAARATMGF